MSLRHLRRLMSLSEFIKSLPLLFLCSLLSGTTAPARELTGPGAWQQPWSLSSLSLMTQQFCNILDPFPPLSRVRLSSPLAQVVCMSYPTALPPPVSHLQSMPSPIGIFCQGESFTPLLVPSVSVFQKTSQDSDSVWPTPRSLPWIPFLNTQPHFSCASQST